MKKLLIVALAIFSQVTGISQTASNDTIKVCYNSLKHMWFAYSPYNIVVRDVSQKEILKLHAVILFSGDSIRFSGIGVESLGDGNYCMNQCKLSIKFADGTEYKKDAWTGEDCEGYSFYDKHGDDSYILDKQINTITLTNGKSNKTYYHNVTEASSANYFHRILKAIKNKEFSISDCE